MKINLSRLLPPKMFSPRSFKKFDPPCRLEFDEDLYFQKERADIRERLFLKQLPCYDRFQKESTDEKWKENWEKIISIYCLNQDGRLNEHKLRELISSLTGKIPVDDAKLDALRIDLNIHNFRKIQEHGYAGQSLSISCDEVMLRGLKGFKKAGLNSIIDLTDSSKYRKFCQERRLKYTSFPVDDSFWYQDIFIHDKEYFSKNPGGDRKFIKDLINFIKAINVGDYYMGCTCGVKRTDWALLVNSYFNPKNSLIVNIESRPNIEYDLARYKERMKNLYQNLTDTDKEELGFTFEFENQLKHKLGIE